MRPLDRRRFLTDTAALAASLAAIPAMPAPARETDDDGDADRKPASPNDTLRVAVCGVRGRGMEHIAGWSKQKDVRITTICDIDLNVTGRASKAIARRYGSEPKVVQDIRRLLDDKSIDAISVATPNHWHALATIWACQAGKDVYVEKPVSHNVSEGRRMVEAARKYERIVQTGTQCRSHKGIQDAIEFLRSGKLGQIYMAKGLCYKPRGSIGHQADGPVPSGRRLRSLAGAGSQAAVQREPLSLQLALVLGLRQWRSGQSGNPPDGPRPLGTGQERVAQGGAGVRGPVRLLRRRSDSEHAARQLRVRRLRASVRGPRPDHQRRGQGQDRRHLLWHRGHPGDHQLRVVADVLRSQARERAGGNAAAATISPISSRPSRARDPKVLNADIEQGHLSSAYCHLGNIAYRLGRKLHINPSTESFVNDSEADAMLTREYRAPFVVPAKV